MTDININDIEPKHKVLTDKKVNESIWNAIYAKLNPSRINSDLLDITTPEGKEKYDLIKQIESLHLRTYPINDVSTYETLNSAEINTYDKMIKNPYIRNKETENEGLLTLSAKPILNISIENLLRNMLENGVDFEPEKTTVEDTYRSKYYTNEPSEYVYYYVLNDGIIDVYYNDVIEDNQLTTISDILDKIPYLPNIVRSVIIDGVYYNTSIKDE
jgi:hypothetical protein